MDCMKITVFGASGGVGSKIVEFALASGHEVRAVYRTPPSLKAHPKLEIIVAENWLQQKSIATAIQGSDAVISAIGLRRKHPFNPFSKIISPHQLTSTFARALIAATQEPHMPKKVVAISAGGIGNSWSSVTLPLRLLFRFSKIGVAYQDLNLMEEIYSKSNLDWICVRPTTLNNRRLIGPVKEADHYGLAQQISRSAVAEYLIQLVESKTSVLNRTPMITN
jgi:putative NADH-flavin reductase